MKIVLKFQILILFTLREISRQIALRPGRVEPVHNFKRFSWSKYGHTSLSQIFPIFFKVLEPINVDGPTHT